MKKILMTLTLAFAAAIAIPTTVNAQQTTETKTAECCANKENCKKQDCKKENCSEKKCNKEICKKEDCKKDNCQNCNNKCNVGQKHKDSKRAKNGKYAMKAGKRVGNKGLKPGKHDGKNPLFKGITLTEEQQTRMTALMDKQRAERQKSKAEAKAARKVEAKKNTAQFEQEIEKILTPEQMKQFNANKEAMKK